MGGLWYNVNREKVSTHGTICVKGTGDIMKKMLSLISACGILLTAIPSAVYASVDVTVDNSWWRTGGNIEKYFDEYKVPDSIVTEYFKDFADEFLNCPDNSYYYGMHISGQLEYAGLFYDHNGEYRDAYYRYDIPGHDIALQLDGTYSIFYRECDEISEEEFNALSYEEKFEKGAEIYYETGTFPFNLRIAESSPLMIYDDEVAADTDTEALERAYTLIKQFVEEQKEDKYSLFFRSAGVCRSTDFFADEDGEIPDNVINEIVIVCDAPDISIIEPLVSKFMQENDINEEIVTYITKDIARVVTKGDINFDNEINVADSTYITQYLAAPDEFLLSDDQKYTADVTGDGDGVTAADALAIQQYLTGDTTAIG